MNSPHRFRSRPGRPSAASLGYAAVVLLLTIGCAKPDKPINPQPPQAPNANATDIQSFRMEVNNGVGVLSQKVTIVFRKPNQWKSEYKRYRQTEYSVFDGETLWRWLVNDQGRIVVVSRLDVASVEKSGKGKSKGAALFLLMVESLNIAGPIVNGHSPLWSKESFAASLAEEYTKVGEEKLGETDTEIYEVQLGRYKGRVWFGKGDGILRRSAGLDEKGNPVGGGEWVSKIEINPALKDDEFAHPGKPKLNLTQDAMETVLETQFAGKHRPGEEIDVEIAPNLKMRFCWIPPGRATLGSPETEERRTSLLFLDEGEHSYVSRGFWLGKYLVTQEEWHALMGTKPSQFQEEQETVKREGIGDTRRFPVDSVSWNQCQEFLAKMNAGTKMPQVLGKGKFVLPLEDEWEYACRGGKGNRHPFYWGEELDGTQANCRESFPDGTQRKSPEVKRTTVVGRYERVAPHPWGLCDMHGNLNEWCEDFANNQGLYSGSHYRGVRGGGWDEPAWESRAAARSMESPSKQSEKNGFRICFRLD